MKPISSSELIQKWERTELSQNATSAANAANAANAASATGAGSLATSNVALAFDGDGTLWSGDVGEDYFHALLAENDFRDAAHACLGAWVEAHQREHATLQAAPIRPPLQSASAAELATYLFAEYAAHRFAEDRICELIAWLPAGRSKGELERFAAHVLECSGLRRRLHPEAQEIVHWAQQTGIPIFVVSASPETIVVPAAELLGIPKSHVCAVRPIYCGDGTGAVMVPDVERPIPYNEGKVTALEAAGALEGRTLLAAFGDNAFDLPMLLSARYAIAIRPKARLRTRVQEAQVGDRLWELDAKTS